MLGADPEKRVVNGPIHPDTEPIRRGRYFYLSQSVSSS